MNASYAPAATIDVADYVDNRPSGPAQRWALALCMAVMFVDAYEVFVLGKIAPVVAAHYGAAVSSLSQVFFLQQVGLAIGAFVATPLADRYGRKRMLEIAVAGFGLLSLATPLLATDLPTLGLLRALAGLFLSGALPMVIALLAETMPRARRGTAIGFALGAYSTGSAAGGIVAAWVVDLAGWQSAFFIGGAMPLLLLPLMLARLPESLHYLAARHAPPERLRRAARGLDPAATIPADAAFVLHRPGNGAMPGSLLRRLLDGRRLLTAVLWAMTFLSMGSIAFMASWLPTFFHSWQGVPVQAFAVLALVAFAGGLAGTVSSGWMLDRFPALLLLRSYYAGLAVCLFLLGQVPFAASGFVGLLIAWNFFQSGGQGLINTVLSRAYPAEVRSTGIGWAGGAGRIGGIVLPSLGGVLLESGAELSFAMGLCALVPAAVVGLTFLLSATQLAAQPAAERSPTT